MAFTPFVETDQPTIAAFNEKFLQCISEAESGKAKIETGSYAGDGGAAKEFFFGFTAQVLFIFELSGSSASGPNHFSYRFLNGAKSFLQTGGGGSYNGVGVDNTATFDGTAISGYGYFNASGFNYKYIAIG